MARIVLLRWPGLLSARAQSQVAEIEQALEQTSAQGSSPAADSIQPQPHGLEQQILDLDRDMQAKIQQAGLEPAWELLQSVPGIQPRGAASILAQTGADMKQFPSSKYFSSWAGVCPGHNRSAGNNHGSRTPGGNPWLGSTLTECAWAAAAIKNSYLKEKFWRIVGRSAGQKLRPSSP